MVRRAVTAIALMALIAAPLAAQGQGRNSARNQGIPPGQMPPPGQCRVWYEGRPPGQQPRPTNCNEAERVASRNRNARVIYGDYGDTRGWGDRDRERNRTREDRGGVYDPRYPDRGYQREGFDQGYRDGVTKAREDMRDNDRYDPARHDWYKSGTRGYNSRDGSREDYRAAYRSGFVRGYDETYRSDRNTDDRRDTGGRRTGSIWDIF